MTRTFSSALAALVVAAATPAAASEPARDAGPPKAAAGAEHDRVGGSAPPAPDPRAAVVVLGLDADAVGRSFAYRDPITTNLRPYDVAGAPAVGGSLELFPLARATDGVLRDVGFFGEYARSTGFDSSTAAGDRVATTYERFRGGLLARVRLGDRSRLAFGGAFGEESFRFDASSSMSASLPSVAYLYLRPSVDARVAVGPVFLLAGAGYRAVLSGGALADRFPRASIGGIDARLGVAVPLGRGLEVSGAALYERYFYAMNPTPGDAYVAGGALDEIFGGQLEVAYAY